MKGINLAWIVIVIIFIVAFGNCKKADIFVAFDTIAQYDIDSVEMADYIIAKGYADEDLDTTSSLVVYTILDEGAGEAIEFDDIVTYNYTVRTTDDTVVLTTYESIAVEYELYVTDTVSIDSVTLLPTEIDTIFTGLSSNEKFTFAPSSWTVLSIVFSSEFVSFLNSPYNQALVELTKKMNIGGHGLMILPSAAFYGGDDYYSDVIYVVEIFPVFVRKTN